MRTQTCVIIQYVGVIEGQYCHEPALTAARNALHLLPTEHNKVCFLLLSGSFNPIHTGHFRVLEAARQHVTNRGWAVLQGFLSPSTDAYVENKLGPDALPFSKRLELCDLSIFPDGWVEVCRTPEVYGCRACVGVKKELEANCFELLCGREIKAIEVLGSDTLLRIFKRLLRENHPSDYNDFICCVQRDKISQESLESFFTSSAHRLHIDLTLVPSPSTSSALVDISSTLIRALIAREDWQELESTGWLAPPVLNTLKVWATTKLS
jgi:nicotinic acid mononucleotide adenylyltransferase